MTPYLETWLRAGRRRTLLEDDAVSVGRGPANTIVLDDEPSVSRLHAVIRPVAGRWSVRDVGSRNGSLLNCARLIGEHVLRPNDELRIGRVRIFYRAWDASAIQVRTEGIRRPPSISPRERDVLEALCAPITDGDMLTTPAAVSMIATQLGISQPAVKQHLLNLYDKFGIAADGTPRRPLLAGEAIQRGAILVSELVDRADGPGDPGQRRAS